MPFVHVTSPNVPGDSRTHRRPPRLPTQPLPLCDFLCILCTDRITRRGWCRSCTPAAVATSCSSHQRGEKGRGGRNPSLHRLGDILTLTLDTGRPERRKRVSVQNLSDLDLHSVVTRFGTCVSGLFTACRQLLFIPKPLAGYLRSVAGPRQNPATHNKQARRQNVCLYLAERKNCRSNCDFQPSSSH